MTLDLDPALMVFAGFLATLSGVFTAFFLQAGYDRARKRDEEQETKIRLLKAIRSELDMNLGMLKEMEKRDMYTYAVTFFLIDSYQSSVYGGNFSLLGPTMQNTLSFTYLQFKEMDIMSDRLTASLSTTAAEGSASKLATILVDAAKEQAKTTIPIVEHALKKIDAELEQLSTGTEASVLQVSAAEVEQMIGVVDDQFAHPSKRTRFWIFVGKYLLILAGLLLMLLAIGLVEFFSFYGKAVPLDTLILGITLGVVTFSVGVSVVITADEEERFQGIEARRHLAELRKKSNQKSPLLLGVLVRMRAALPIRATLRESYDLNSSAFKVEDLVRRALEL